MLKIYIFSEHPVVRHLVVVLHELQDDTDVVGIVLDGDDSHNVGRVLRVWVLQREQFKE